MSTNEYGTNVYFADNRDDMLDSGTDTAIRKAYSRTFVEDHDTVMARIESKKAGDDFFTLTQTRYSSESRTYEEVGPFSIRPSWIAGVETRKPLV